MEAQSILVLENLKQTLVIVEELHKAGFRVILGVQKEEQQSSPLYDQAVRLSQYVSEVWEHPFFDHHQQFFTALESFERNTENLIGVFPVGELSLKLLHSRERSPYPIFGASSELVNLCLDKSKYYPEIKKINVPIPEFHITTDLTSALAMTQTNSHEWILKPSNSFQQLNDKKAIFIRPDKEISLLPERLNDETQYILQKVIKGNRHNCMFSANNGTLFRYFESIVRQTNSFDGTGYSVESVSIDPKPNHFDWVQKILSHLKYDGTGCVQFIHNPKTNQSFFLELNPRIDATLRLAQRCKIPLVLDLVQLQTTHSFREQTNSLSVATAKKLSTAGNQFSWSLGYLNGILHAVLKKEIKLAEFVKSFISFCRSSATADCHAVFKWSDPKPFLKLLAGHVAAGLRKIF